MTAARATVVLVVLLLVGGAACGDDDATDGGRERSATPARLDSRTLEGARAHLATVASPGGFVTGVAWRAGDDALYVAAREGQVHRHRPGSPDPDPAAPVVDLSDRTDAEGEDGLFDVAFTIDGEELLLSYAERETFDLLVVAVPIDPSGRAGAVREVVRVGDGSDHHHGGEIEVEADGSLLLGVGDGDDQIGAAGRARVPGGTRGRIVRVPGAGRAGTEAGPPEDVAIGLRNPWRFSVDPVTGRTWVADVGQAEVEEIDVIEPDEPAVVDFGWDRVEGARRFRGTDPGATRLPVLVVPHDGGHCAITGGVVVRDGVLPALVGAYAFGDYCSSEVRFVLGSGDDVEQRRLLLPDGVHVLAVVAGPHHEVLVARDDGILSRLEPGGPLLADDPASVGPPGSDPAEICGLSAALTAVPALLAVDVELARQLGPDLVAALDHYDGADLPAEVQPAYDEIAAALRPALSALEAVGWDVAASDFGALVGGSAGTALFEQLAAAETSLC